MGTCSKQHGDGQAICHICIKMAQACLRWNSRYQAQWKGVWPAVLYAWFCFCTQERYKSSECINREPRSRTNLHPNTKITNCYHVPHRAADRSTSNTYQYIYNVTGSIPITLLHTPISITAVFQKTVAHKRQLQFVMIIAPSCLLQRNVCATFIRCVHAKCCKALITYGHFRERSVSVVLHYFCSCLPAPIWPPILCHRCQITPDINSRIHKNAHTHVHTCTHTYIHTHICAHSEMHLHKHKHTRTCMNITNLISLHVYNQSYKFACI